MQVNSRGKEKQYFESTAKKVEDHDVYHDKVDD